MTPYDKCKMDIGFAEKVIVKRWVKNVVMHTDKHYVGNYENLSEAQT